MLARRRSGARAARTGFIFITVILDTVAVGIMAPVLPRRPSMKSPKAIIGERRRRARLVKTFPTNEAAGQTPRWSQGRPTPISHPLPSPAFVQRGALKGSRSEERRVGKG